MLFGTIEPVETDRTSVTEEGEEKEQQEKARYCPNISILALSFFSFESHSLSRFFYFSILRWGKTSNPRNLATSPNSSSIRNSWLYLAMRSVREADPVLI